MQTLAVRVLALKNLEGDVVRYLDQHHGAVTVTCDAFEKHQEAVSLHGLKKGSEVHWSNNTNTLSWTQSVQSFQELRAAQPTLKFHLMSTAPSNSHSNTFSPARAGGASSRQGGEDCGFFLLDLRSIPVEEFHEGGEEEGEWQRRGRQEVKVNQLHGATALICPVLLAHHPSVNPLTHSQGQTHRHNQGHSHRHSDVAASHNSLASVLSIPSHYDLEASLESLARYTLSLTLSATRHMQLLPTMTQQGQAHTSTAPSAIPSTLWFSWSILDVTLQTPEFDPMSPKQLQAATDSLFFECSEAGLLNLLEELGAMRVFLCAPGAVLGWAEIPFPQHMNRLPFRLGGWYALQCEGQEGPEQPAVQLSFEVCPSEPVLLDEKESKEGMVRIKETSVGGGNGNDGNEEYSEDEYDEEFSSHGDDGARQSTQGHPLLLLRGQGKSTVRAEESSEQSEEELDDADKERDEFEERHWRVCLQVKTLRATRPVRASLQFSYPRLGLAVVRTHNQWTEANMETVVDGAVATFDCSLTTPRLTKIFQEERFVVQVLSRSHLGVTKYGDASIDLGKLHAATPHSFVCPLTNKAFKTLAQYRHHRQLMIALHSAGKVEHVPSFSPITLKTIDTYLPVLMAGVGSKGVENVGKLRVLLTLEDFGPNSSGAMSDIQLRQSHSQPQASHVTPPVAGEGAEGRGDLQSNTEQRLEWERWRQKEEDKWTSALREKELLLRQRLEEEAAISLSQRADDLKRAQEEVGRLEVRLRASIGLVEQQKAQIGLKEEQMSARLAQKTSELELLQRRVREEAKAKIEAESRRAGTLEAEVTMLTEQLARTTMRAERSERDYEEYKTHVRAMPETSLREETSRLKAQLGELRTEIERERRLRGETELEKEHYRSQMHRVATALKREREKSSAVARQELEQLRLEFLSREERYVLDGDRDELRTIRRELSGLRNLEAANIQHKHHHHHHNPQQQTQPQQHYNQKQPSSEHLPPRRSDTKKVVHVRPALDTSLNMGEGRGGGRLEKLHRASELRKELLSSELYHTGDPVIAELDRTILQAEMEEAEEKGLGGAAEDK